MGYLNASKLCPIISLGENHMMQNDDTMIIW